MKNIFVILLLCFISVFAFGQQKKIIQADEFRVNTGGAIKINGLKITGFSIDTSFANPSDLILSTQLATIRAIENHVDASSAADLDKDPLNEIELPSGGAVDEVLKITSISPRVLGWGTGGGGSNTLEGSLNGLPFKNITGTTLARLFYRLDEETLFFGKSNSLTWGNPKINASVILGTGNTASQLINPFASTLVGYNVAGTSVNANSITSVGYQSLNFLRDGYNISAMGTDAGFNLRDVVNANVIGRHQFFTGDGTILLDGANINAFGVDCFPVMTTATNLISIGNTQGSSMTSALQSIIIGDEAARFKPSVTGTHLKGYQVGYIPSNPAGQVGVIAANVDGYRAMYNQHSFDYATARGYQAGYLDSYNAAYISTRTHLDGYQSGFNVYGLNNTFMGYRTGARTTPTNITGAVAIGYRVGDGWINSNELAIDNNNTTSPLLYGNFTTNVARINGTLQVSTVVNNNTNTNVLVINPTTGALETNTTFGAGGLWETDGTDVWRTAGNVGVGVGNPTFPMQVNGTIVAQSGSNSVWFGNDVTGGYLRTFGSNNFTFRSSSGATTMTLDNATNRIGLGITTPTAKLHIAAGTTAAGTAPLKLTTGTLLTTPEVGALEFASDRLYFTKTTGATREYLLTSSYQPDFTAISDSIELAASVDNSFMGWWWNPATNDTWRNTGRLNLGTSTFHTNMRLFVNNGDIGLNLGKFKLYNGGGFSDGFEFNDVTNQFLIGDADPSDMSEIVMLAPVNFNEPVELDNVLELTPTATVPASPTMGTIYFDDGTNTVSTNPAPRFYNGTAWVDMD